VGHSSPQSILTPVLIKVSHFQFRVGKLSHEVLFSAESRPAARTKVSGRTTFCTSYGAYGARASLGMPIDTANVGREAAVVRLSRQLGSRRRVETGSLTDERVFDRNAFAMIACLRYEIVPTRSR